VSSGRASLPAILLVGGGRMGSALLAGWRQGGISKVIVVDPSPEAARLVGGEVSVAGSISEIPSGFNPQAVVLAIKPQAADDAVPALRAYAERSLFLSIMAGKTVGWLAYRLGDAAAIIRAMPNTPAAVHQGMTVAVAGSMVSARQLALGRSLLEAVGLVSFVEDEALLDPVTAVSGGGPAYVFLLAELLEQAAMQQGIPAPLARDLARQTIIGSGALLAASDEEAAALRRAVTSPKGTTERALAVLMANQAWPASVSAAIAAATARSRELGG
jgi:pyrroline-5-carboxylate reductase